MTPQELITRLRYLAEQAPIDAVLFRVPSAPSATYHHMRLDVSPRDVLDLCNYVEYHTARSEGRVTEVSQ